MSNAGNATLRYDLVASDRQLSPEISSASSRPVSISRASRAWARSITTRLQLGLP